MISTSFRGLFRSVLVTGAAVAVLGLAALNPARAEDKAGDEKNPSVWMKKKLQYSQQILSGLALADFDQIQDAAEHLRALNKIEAFIRARTPSYRNQLQVFQDSNEEILRQATARNLEGTTMAFTQMTFSCVNCHKQLRAQ